MGAPGGHHTASNALASWRGAIHPALISCTVTVLEVEQKTSGCHVEVAVDRIAARDGVEVVIQEYIAEVADEPRRASQRDLESASEMPAEVAFRSIDLQRARVGVEVMDTRAACRTYNILVAEGRKIAAALIL